MTINVLIIDDHRDYRELLGHHVTSEWPAANVVKHDPSGSGPEATVASLRAFDVVLLDHRLGEQDGLSWLRTLRAAADCPPVVYLTPERDEAAAVEAIRAGAADCIPKRRISNHYLVNAIKQSLADEKSATQTMETLIRSGPVEKLAEPVPLPGFRPLRRLSADPDTCVWLARRESDDRELVVKIMAALPDGDEGRALAETFDQACSAYEAIDHHAVATMHGHGISAGRPWLAIEYFPGGQLGKRLGVRMPPRTAIDYVTQIAAALDVLHYCDIVHGDLKPANILLRNDESLAIGDFGIARQMTDRAVLTIPGRMLAGVLYAAPEQALGKPVDERTDLYALGLIFFEMLTGRKPYPAASPLAVMHKHCHAPLPDLPQSLSPLRPVVHQLLSKDPAGRPQSAAEVLDLLSACKKM